MTVMGHTLSQHLSYPRKCGDNGKSQTDDVR